MKLDDVALCRRPRSASRQRCAAPTSAPAIFPRLMSRPPFFSLNSSSSTSSTLSSQRRLWSTCSAAVLRSSTFVLSRSTGSLASTSPRRISNGFMCLAGPATRHQLGRDHSSCSTLWSLRMRLSLRLLVSDLEGPTKIRVIDAPKLTALVYLSAKFSELFIGSVIVQVHHSSSSPSS